MEWYEEEWAWARRAEEVVEEGGIARGEEGRGGKEDVELSELVRERKGR